jgi:hypothetical protein
MVISWDGPGSEKDFTAHKCVNEVSHPVFPGSAGIKHRLKLCPIRKANRRSGGMQHEMRKKAFGQLPRVRGKMRFECVDIGEGFAGGKFSRCIDKLSDKISIWMTAGSVPVILSPRSIPRYRSRHAPITSKLSIANPTGSNFA